MTCPRIGKETKKFFTSVAGACVNCCLFRRNATWVYFGGLTLFAIPNVLAFFIFIRRAAERGYIPQTRRHYSWNIFSPKSMLKNLNRFDTRNDFWGLAAWSLGTVSLALGMTISPTQQLVAARHFLTCVGLGVLCNFALWEFYLNRRNAHQWQTDDLKDSPPPPGPPSIISLIVVQNNNGVSAELDAHAALTATRLRRMRRRKQRGPVYSPLLSQSLFAATSQITVCSFCAALESVSRALGTWIVRDAPVLYAEPNWKHWYLCVSARLVSRLLLAGTDPDRSTSAARLQVVWRRGCASCI